MPEITCELFCHSNSPHLQQLYTGFSLLHRKGALKLSYHILRKRIPELRGMGPNSLRVVLNGDKVLVYDVFDGSRIKPDILSQVDFYFKRSFLSSEVATELAHNRVLPLGLNYLVYESSPSVFSFRRTALERGVARRAKHFSATILFDRLIAHPRLYAPRESTCLAYPKFEVPSRVLFMTHLWDPRKTSAKTEALGLSRESREAINEMRAACVRALKKAFGDRFFGGIAPDEYSEQYYRDCLLPRDLARKGVYMALLHQYPVCIATTGLFGSIGWKFAEYVCHAKAIVSEKLNYEVPGPMANGKNYLEFTTPEGCVEAVDRLFSNHPLCFEMMMNNYRYYQSYLRPDSLVLNTLTVAMRDQPSMN